MRLSIAAILSGTFAAAAALSFAAAHVSARAVEQVSRGAVLEALHDQQMHWAEVDTDGLQVYLFGTAPDEATRFAALSVAGSVVDTARLIDQMLVVETSEIVVPRFALELLSNETGLSVIGLVPAATDRELLLRRLSEAAGGAQVSDFLETADYPVPEGWTDAMRLARGALEALPRSKISVSADRVVVKAMTANEAEKQRLESRLARDTPDGVQLALDLSAPRPVIAPFVLRFTSTGGTARFDLCSADSETTRDRLLRAASEAGHAGKATCRLGLGVPTPEWGAAAEAGLRAVAALGGGTLTITDTDMRIEALMGTGADTFDRAVGDLEAALPEVFVLTAERPEPPAEAPAEAEIRDFVATLSPEGIVQLRGHLPNALARQTADSVAKSHFGSDAVHMGARLDSELPRGWSLRALTALEALAMLANGAATVTADGVSVSGRTGREDAQAAITALLTEKLGDGASLAIDVVYVEELDPARGIPTPEECEARITQIIGNRKITFEPAAATLDRSAEDILDELAEMLKQCGDIPLEISGHTDSQGRETMNQSLSQDRAQAVLDGLRRRLVPTRSYTVTGYGEERPIADNDTEEGREANRRIEFRLIRPEPVEETATTLEQAEDAPTDDAAAAIAEPDATGDTGSGDDGEETGNE